MYAEKPLPLRYLIVPILMIVGLVFLSAFFLTRFTYDDTNSCLAFSFIIALVVGFPIGLYVAVFIAQVALGRIVWDNFRVYAYEARYEKTEPESEPVTVRAESEGGNQVDFFRGLTPGQWHKCAVKIAAHIRAGNRSFTFAVVGQTERPLLVPMMLLAEYIESVGEGEYRITDKGANWWLALAALPYPWEHAPQKLRNLPMESIYT